MFDSGRIKESARAAPARSTADVIGRTITINPNRVLGRLTAVAKPGDVRDAYLVAAAAVQFWADAALAASMTGERSAQGLAKHAGGRANAAADAAARALVGNGPVQRPKPLRIDADLTIATNASGAVPLEKLLTSPLPEFCGYNLADIEVCVTDASWLADRCAPRVLVVGIRSGGGMLAPLWAAALAARGVAASWTTLRPSGQAVARSGYDGDEIARARALLGGAPTDLVVVDDLPDTGATVAQLAALLVPHAARAWFAAVGCIEELDAHGRRTAAHAVTPVLPGRSRRLWQLLLPPDHAAFADRLGEHLAQRLPDKVQIKVRRPELEVRYGRRTPWLVWNDPALALQQRRLINPRKTPLTVESADGTPLWHLRFIGDGPWGRAEHVRVEAEDEIGACFIDGYRVSPHVPGLAALAERLCVAEAADRERLLARSADRLSAIIDGASVAVGDLGQRDVGAALRSQLELLARRFDLPALLSLRSLSGVAAGAPSERSTRTLYTSLRYSHGHWHWQADAAGTVLRFQRETTWGGVSTAELEVASFAMEHALTPDELASVAEKCGVMPRSVVGSLADALLIMMKALCRSVREVDAAGRERLRGDVAARYHWMERVAAAG